MTWAWGPSSRRVREEITWELQIVVDTVLDWSPFDLTLSEGYRSDADQEAAFNRGASEIRSGGRHNSQPSMAVHIEPYPINYDVVREDDPFLARYILLAGLMIAAGKHLSVELRWLGTTSLRDYAHWEIKT